MSDSRKLAVAAHLHVMLRRKTGRVTDTEWMAANAEYAREIVRFARARALEDGEPELRALADQFERVMFGDPRPAGAATPPDDLDAPATPPATTGPRYVGGLR